MQPETAVVWKSWLMDCPCLEASNWPLIPHWCLLSTAMVQRAGDHDGVVLEATNDLVKNSHKRDSKNGR